MSINEIVANQISNMPDKLSTMAIDKAYSIYSSGCCQILTQSPALFELLVTTEPDEDIVYYSMHIEDEDIIPVCSDKRTGWDVYSYACLLQMENEINLTKNREMPLEHKKYSREGMISRVLLERKQKADKANYKIRWSDNIFGDHILINEEGKKYKVFLRDFENETGYSDSPDLKHNKLGTTKHIMYAFRVLKENKSLFDRLKKSYPFIEIYCDPLNDYKITWNYPDKLTPDQETLINKYFKRGKHINESEHFSFLDFIKKAEQIQEFKIRPEVYEKIERSFENMMLDRVKQDSKPDWDLINAELYNYQKEGIEFATYKKVAIIADEMGLGKTIQAIGAAIQKKNIFDLDRTLVVCPASLKYQWKEEIERFSDSKAIVIEGTPEERQELYSDKQAFFFIVNYETVLRDKKIISDVGFDFLILDEAQKVKNYETKTWRAIKSVEAKHKLVITGTPIENHLIDIFSIMSILDPEFLGPLWEFSYQHCLFDIERHNKINGYYNLQELSKKLDTILIRREKRRVIDQLPNIQQITIPVDLTTMQRDMHDGFASGIGKIINKKFLTPFDLQRLQMLLSKMRMACDSTYLIDEDTNESGKLEELKDILINKLDVGNNSSKIIIFSEWVKVHKLIGQMLRENNIGFVELNGKIPAKHRGELIKKFEDNENYKIFLSTEAGGAGLNLQVADTVINFELPWNPAKKNQRIGRIDRLGQQSNKLTIYNFVSRDSIEQRIAAGLLVKQNLFDGVLNDSQFDYVDFSTKGRSQFINELEEFINDNNNIPEDDMIEDQFIEEDEIYTEPEIEQKELSFTENDRKGGIAERTELDSETVEETPVSQKTEEVEKVLNSGMEFLSGIFKMATGKDIGMDDKKIEVNKETGEVTMKFKIPV
jgi:SNF2 family DNA or RNA helicase